MEEWDFSEKQAPHGISALRSLVRPFYRIFGQYDSGSWKRNSYRANEVDSIMDYRERITIEPGKRSGKPCIRGMRITVSDILEYLASGMSWDEVLDDFPYLEREDIVAALMFAANQDKRIMYIQAG